MQDETQELRKFMCQCDTRTMYIYRVLDTKLKGASKECYPCDNGSCLASRLQAYVKD